MPLDQSSRIDVYPHAPRNGLVDRSADVAEVLFGRAAELLAAVLERPFGQQVHNAASGVAEPVEGYAAVDESQRLDAVRIAFRSGPLGDAPHGLLLALRDPRRSDLDAADAQFLQQQPGDGELFAGVERNARRLLAVAQRGIHYFDRGKHRRGLFSGLFEPSDLVGDAAQVIHVVVAVLQAAFLVGVDLEPLAAARGFGGQRLPVGSTVKRAAGSSAMAAKIAARKSSLTVIGSRPLLRALLRKMSAKKLDTTTRKP